MIQVYTHEKSEVVANCDHLTKLRFSSTLPKAFTEHGVLMLANVLRSEKAFQVSVEIIRAFIRMKKELSGNDELRQKVGELEKKVKTQSGEIKLIFATINTMLSPVSKKKRQIGFGKV